MLLPAAVAIHGDHAAIAELKGRVTLVNKDGLKLIEPARWRPGISTAPHGIAFDSDGDLFVSEFSIFGRVLRFDKSSGAAR